MRTTQNTIMGSFATVTTCKTCGGEGKIVSEPCTTCRGKGRANKTRSISINIPAGIDNGQTISLAGEGEPGKRGGPAGDLYVNIRVKPHKLFVRNGYDLNLEMKVSYALAAIGGEVSIPTLEGDVSYKIPEGTQPGTVFYALGQGHTAPARVEQGRLEGARADRGAQEAHRQAKRAAGRVRRDIRKACRKGRRAAHKQRSFFEKVKDAFN